MNLRSNISIQNEKGHLKEFLIDQSGDYLIVAPHGGDLEPYTFSQAIKLAERSDCDVWATDVMSRGNTFQNWHYSSNDIDVEKFTYLRDLEYNYDTVISFHGTKKNEIIIGGREDPNNRRELESLINDKLPDTDTVIADGNTDLNGYHPENIVNRRSDNSQGIQLEQPFQTRSQNWETIVECVDTYLSNI